MLGDMAPPQKSSWPSLWVLLQGFSHVVVAGEQATLLLTRGGYLRAGRSWPRWGLGLRTETQGLQKGSLCSVFSSSPWPTNLS